MTFYTPPMYIIIGYAWTAKCIKADAFSKSSIMHSMHSWSVCYRTDFNVGFRLTKRKVI